MSEWIELLKTQALARRCIVLNGNSEDIFLSCKNTWLSCQNLVVEELKALGWPRAVVWDRTGGERYINCSAEDFFSKKISSGNNIPLGSNSRETPRIKMDFGGFLGLASRVFSNEDHLDVVLIADYSSFLFSSENSLSDEQLQTLLHFRKIISEAPLDSQRRGLLVLILNNTAHFPLRGVQNHPSIREIGIPKPSRESREAYLMEEIGEWKLSEPIGPRDKVFNDLVDATEGFTLRDLRQLQRLSRLSEQRLGSKELLSQYRHGQKTSPWEMLNKDKIRDLRSTLKERVKGQDEAVDRVVQMVKRAYTGFSGIQHSTQKQTPKGILFFVGPTGVGKTELAKALAAAIFGDEDACVRFDMSEYNHEHSDQRLVGAPPGYVGYEEGGQLTNAVKGKPFSVILFDEIEKAHGRILDKFLQILEDGRLTDGKGETVYFSDTVIIFTSNIGASTIELSEDSSKKFIEAVEDHFWNKLNRPEILNRIGSNIVPFRHLKDPAIFKEIILSKIRPMEKFLQIKYEVRRLNLDEQLIEGYAQSFHGQSGGRGLLNHMVDELLEPLSDFIFEKEPLELQNKTLHIKKDGEKLKISLE